MHEVRNDHSKNPTNNMHLIPTAAVQQTQDNRASDHLMQGRVLTFHVIRKNSGRMYIDTWDRTKPYQI